MSTDQSTPTYKLRIRRTDGSSTDHSVPLANPHARILDALLYVRQKEDPKLGFRYSCRVGMCGSCALVVNGRECLSCQTKIADLGSGTIDVRPLRSLPTKNDLIPDMNPFFDAMKRAHAALDPTEPELRDIRTMPPDDPNRATIEEQNGCITCGACFSACEWTRTHDGYLGPAALNRLFMLACDERDARTDERVAQAATAEGALRCHTAGSCSIVCPVDVPLKKGMQRLKHLITRSL